MIFASLNISPVDSMFTFDGCFKLASYPRRIPVITFDSSLNNNNNNNNTIFSQGDSISYKYNCYQEKPCIKLKS